MTLSACIAGSFAISILAVHAFYIGATLSHSVPFARATDATGSLFLAPAHAALFLLDAMLGASTTLPDPRLLAAINGVLVGLCLYCWLQRKRKPEARLKCFSSSSGYKSGIACPANSTIE